MNFVDRTGHTFSQLSFDVNPIGWEFERNEYIFWVDSNESQYRLSKDCYYIKQINPYFEKPIKSVRVECQSQIFCVFGYDSFVESDVFRFELDVANLKDKHGKSNVTITTLLSEGDETIAPFYVLCKPNEESTFTTQCLITAEYEDGTFDYCPITLGCVCVEISEQLQINGYNVGVTLPQDVLNGVYQFNHNNAISDVALYNEKLKEYLMNIVRLKHECGNYRSAIASLGWFGYGDIVSISRLLKTDNNVFNQYIRDDFTITNDVIQEYDKFVYTAYISLTLDEYRETGKMIDEWDFSKEFWGEPHPEMEDLFDKVVENHYDNTEIEYYTPFYKYTFIEMCIKMSLLKYYYQKYFLPIHLDVKTSSVLRKVFANDIKMVTNATTHLTSNVVMTQDDCVVEFDNRDVYWQQSNQIIDGNYVSFDNVIEEEIAQELGLFESHELCFKLPFRFYESATNKAKNDLNSTKPFNYSITISKCIEKNVYVPITTTITSSTQPIDGEYTIDGYVVYTDVFKNLIFRYFYESDWSSPETNIETIILGKYKIDICLNGRWFSHIYEVKLPTVEITCGKLEYKYDKDVLENELIFERRLVETNSSTMDDSFIIYADSGIKHLPIPHDTGFSCPVNITLTNKSSFNIPNQSIRPDLYNTIVWYSFDREILQPEYEEIFTELRCKKGLCEAALNLTLHKQYYDFYDMLDGSNNPFFHLTDNDYYSIDNSNRINYSYFEKEKRKLPYYIVAISKQTDCGDELPQTITFKHGVNLTLTKTKTEKRFLINRMKYVEQSDWTFDSTDIIVVGTKNLSLPYTPVYNWKSQFIAHWVMNPITNKDETSRYISKSNTTFGIMSIPKGSMEFKQGVYDITCTFMIHAPCFTMLMYEENINQLESSDSRRDIYNNFTKQITSKNRIKIR